MQYLESVIHSNLDVKSQNKYDLLYFRTSNIVLTCDQSTEGNLVAKGEQGSLAIYVSTCITTPKLVPISVSLARDRDIAYHVAIQ